MFFLIFVISQSLHCHCVSAFPTAPVNPNLAYLLNNLRQLLICILFCIFSWKTGPRVSFSESSIFGRPPQLGWTDSGRVLLYNPGRPHSNTSTKQIFYNSIIIVDKEPRVDTGWHWSAVLAIWLTCYLRSELLLYWCEFHFFIASSQLYVYTFKKPELYPAFHWTLTLLCQEKETTVILWNLLQRYCYTRWTCKTSGEHCLGTSRMSIVMFAGKSAKC